MIFIGYPLVKDGIKMIIRAKAIFVLIACIFIFASIVNAKEIVSSDNIKRQKEILIDYGMENIAIENQFGENVSRDIKSIFDFMYIASNTISSDLYILEELIGIHNKMACNEDTIIIKAHILRRSTTLMSTIKDNLSLIDRSCKDKRYNALAVINLNKLRDILKTLEPELKKLFNDMTK